MESDFLNYLVLAMGSWGGDKSSTLSSDTTAYRYLW